MNRSIAGWVTHRWAKWVVLVLSSLVDRRTSARLGTKLDQRPGQRHQLVAARRRRVDQGHQRSRPTSPTPTPSRPSCSTSATPASRRPTSPRPRPTPRRSRDVENVDDDVVGPIPSKDGKAIQLIAHDRRSATTAGNLARPRRRHQDDRRKRHRRSRRCSLAGPAALGADQAKAFARHRRHPAVLRRRHRVRDPADHLSQPQLAILFLFCGVGAASAPPQGVVYLLAKTPA